MKAKEDFDKGLCIDPQACKVKFFTVVKPFGSEDDGGDDPLFLTGRAYDTIITFDPPFELHIGKPPDWIADGIYGGLWAIYCMRVKILADEMKVLESGVAFLQCLSMSVHWGHLNSAAEGCKKMMCTLGQDIAVQMQPPPASCASSSAVPTAGVMVPAQQVAVASTAYDSIWQCHSRSHLAEASPWASMMD